MASLILRAAIYKQNKSCSQGKKDRLQYFEGAYFDNN
jgi:hypothetical protein